MSELSQNLLRWADELASDRWQQIRGDFAAHNFDGVCALGCAGIAMGDTREAIAERGGISMRVIEALGLVWSASGPGPVERRIVREVQRIRGDERYPYSGYNAIPVLNDEIRVDFPTFARAIRTVARQMEEEEYGAPIVATEPAREIVEVS